MTSLRDVRTTFLDFFAERSGLAHEKVPSAPLVPQNDPTLLFVNAGMVPFKNLFTGLETRAYTRATSAQKCVRAGGKHNDLDNVGYTARHHTFFEMLGNFSFGDYFKEDAIACSWDLVTKVFGLPTDKLLVTVYHTDDQAFALWQKIAGLDERRIIRINTSDNFWTMGDTGPCGPCSEIFYDHGEAIPGGPPGSPDEDGDRFIEIWNLVFMQHERLADGTQVDLPKPSIDTGMGLERMSAILQGVHSNYEVDLFRHLIETSENLTGRKAQGDDAPAHRVIADHLRSAAFLIADGVNPSNEGRGYVLRRIMRRAMRYAHGLGARDPLLARMVPVLSREMGGAYPELRRAEALIVQTLDSEERKFKGLLERGMKLLDQETATLAAGAPLPGAAAFKLYDTYGFPLDLTQDALRRDGRSVDVAGFEAAMAEQKAAARAAWSGSGDSASEAIWLQVRDDVGTTEFLGYQHDSAEGAVVAIVRDGARVETARAGDAVELVVNQTPFYAESGGQIGDHGIVQGADGLRLTVSDTRKRAGAVHGHVAMVDAGTVSVGDTVRLSIDTARRAQIRSNHSATHLVHAALRNVLGPHVTQKGSLVSEDRLRFDFSHPQALTTDEMAAINAEVNAVIRQNADAETRIMPYDDAVEAGAMALFGEKYDDDVRVLSMGTAVDGADNLYSVELCGGTHVNRTGDIALFTIIAESAVSAGVRRIEALTGEAARQHFEEQAGLLRGAAETLKASPRDLTERLETLVAERRKLEKELAEARKKLALAGNASSVGGQAAGATGAQQVNGIAFVGQVLEGIPPRICAVWWMRPKRN